MWSYVIETLFSVGMVINAGLFIPQAIKLYQTKDPKTLSLVMFAGFNVIQCTTIAHGMLTKDYLLIGGTILNMITSGVITLLLVFYTVKRSRR